ncbi:phosphoenolpyruvate--protein phosphotransferase [Candidatus Cetobacterium colombiensis]|uniref:Phosphoenolpyruvate-protein phosphotransferase n=1 Tax=Candidatus Cetobacterium colombiensis TaxID=3073100 RepID=A0ABU4WBC1_9FUSO|nr:phosphoenolpyruvate--protein phosphotransferase [Candidatus Cetobacterium colombiensis]MDX8336455.1 phosphoenolpyruvate--protein phosphotransferase [Candidatus Cetobacterium colombiensis]
MGVIIGKSIFPGIVIGQPYIERKKKLDIENYKIASSKIDEEIKRFLESVQKAKNDIKQIKSNLEGKISKEDLQILTVHIMMLDDPQFINDIKKGIKKEENNAEAVVKKVSNKYIEMFEKIADPIYKQRALDIKDISERIIMNLTHEENAYLNLNGKILVIRELLPSELLKMYYSGVNLSGIIMEYMGETSHTAILTKALEIPTLMGGNDIFSVDWGDQIILDTTKIEGKVVTNPDIKTLNKFEEEKNRYKNKIKEINESIDKETITLDGERVCLYLNIGARLDITQVSRKRPDGIGLLRTELIYMDAIEFPDEDKQKKIYENIAREFDQSHLNKPIVIRTLDIGADKKLSYYKMVDEENPSLGCRGMRLTLSDKDLFKNQIKGILRAAKHHNIKMMYPMITNLREIQEARELVDQCKAELLQEGKEFKEDIEIGMMVEVPSNVMLADIFIDHVDFFSIGTNDLTQYILATDRYSPIAEKLYDSYDPAVMRAIEIVTNAGIKKNKKVSVCGEMAGEELAAIALLSFGVRDLSMIPAYIPKIRNLVRKIKISELKIIKENILKSKDSQEVKNILSEYLEKIEGRN